MIKHARIVIVGAIGAIALAACGHGHDHRGHRSAVGEPGDAKSVSRTIEIEVLNANGAPQFDAVETWNVLEGQPLRISVFAQPLGARGGVSATRLSRDLEALGG